MTAHLRAIYGAETATEAENALAQCEASPESPRYLTVVPIWERAWDYLTPAFAYQPEVRHILTTTNAIKNLHRQFPKVITMPGHSPTDEAAVKLLDLALPSIKAIWGSTPEWMAALPPCAILFGDRFTLGT